MILSYHLRLNFPPHPQAHVFVFVSSFSSYRAKQIDFTIHIVNAILRTTTTQNQQSNDKRAQVCISFAQILSNPCHLAHFRRHRRQSHQQNFMIDMHTITRKNNNNIKAVEYAAKK